MIWAWLMRFWFPPRYEIDCVIDKKLGFVAESRFPFEEEITVKPLKVRVHRTMT